MMSSILHFVLLRAGTCMQAEKRRAKEARKEGKESKRKDKKRKDKDKDRDRDKEKAQVQKGQMSTG